MGYPLTDGRVNVRLSTNATQQVTSTNQPDAFGISSVTAGTASAYSYGGAVGYRQDGIAPAGLPSAYGFQKVGARYYDPAFGAFLTRDTELGQSPYAYCDGDPVNCSDPSGHSAKEIGWGLVGAVAGLILGTLLLAFLAPEVTLGVGIFAAINLGIEASGIASIMVPGLTSLGGGAAGVLLAEGSEEKDRPQKAGGDGGASVATRSQNQDWRQGKGNNWYPYGAPYSGSPHGPPLPPGAITH